MVGEEVVLFAADCEKDFRGRSMGERGMMMGETSPLLSDRSRSPLR